MVLVEGILLFILEQIVLLYDWLYVWLRSNKPSAVYFQVYEFSTTNGDSPLNDPSYAPTENADPIKVDTETAALKVYYSSFHVDCFTILLTVYIATTANLQK